MAKNPKKCLLVIITSIMILLSACAVPRCAFAKTFSFTVIPNPYRGWSDLRFEKVDQNGEFFAEGLTVNISTDKGTRYVLEQSNVASLVNYAIGVSIPDNNFVFYTRRNSAAGQLNYIEQETPVRGMKNIYTSNTPSDAFDLVYLIKSPLEVPQGAYTGQISFTLRDLDDPSEPQKVVTLKVSVQVGSNKPVVEVATVNESKTITLNSAKEELSSAEVSVNVKSFLGAPYRILQSMSDALESSDGSQLPYDVVNFMIGESKKGSGPMRPIPLSMGLAEIYKSNSSGSPDNFIITYALAKTEDLKAGRYTTKLQYRLEGEQGPIQKGVLDNLGLEVIIEPKFDIIVKLASETGTIEFLKLSPSGEAKTYEVTIETKTNVGKRYQVTQHISSELITKEGKTIPPESFTLKTESLDSKGVLKFPDKAAVKKGDTVLLASDEKGSSDTFKIIYELKPPKEPIIGDFSTSVSYSISEI